MPLIKIEHYIMIYRKISILLSFSLLMFSQLTHAASVVESEPNDTFASPQSISSNIFTIGANPELQDDTLPTATITGDIAAGNQNDVDFYCFNALAGSPLFLDIDYGEAQGDSVDTELSLFNSAGTLLAQNDDTSPITVGGTGTTDEFDAFIGEFTIPSTGRYCVAVTSYSNQPNTLGNGTISGTNLSLGGRSFTGATIGDSTFDNTGGSTGDYTLHISTRVPVAIVPTSVPTLSEWMLLLLMFSLGLIGIKSKSINSLK